MGLRKAIEALPDDRETASALRLTLSFFQSHPDEPVSPARIGRATGISLIKAEQILDALAKGFVIDCGGAADMSHCRFRPTTVVSLEIQRYLRSGSGTGARLQRGADRFRNRYGTGR